MPRPSSPPDLSTFAGQIGAEIRRRRELAKLTVPDAAERAGVPAATWYNWEQGRHRMSVDALPAIASGC